MTCNNSEKLNRIVAGIAILVVLTAANNAFALESDMNASGQAGSQTSASAQTDGADSFSVRRLRAKHRRTATCFVRRL